MDDRPWAALFGVLVLVILILAMAWPRESFALAYEHIVVQGQRPTDRAVDPNRPPALS